MSWAAQELKGIDLGDKRLDKRAVLPAEKPTASIPQACGGWGEPKPPIACLSRRKRTGGTSWSRYFKRAHSMCCASRTVPSSMSTARLSAAWGH